VGEGIAIQDLFKKGFTILKWNPPEQLPGGDIEAMEAALRRRILVQVKSDVQPNPPHSLSTDEEEALKSRAMKIGAEAWEAKVQLDSSLQQGTVTWRRL
jgi:hypothetical protein